jgi:hypothetical protein
MTADDTGPRPICPCRRNAASPSGQGMGPTPAAQTLTREIPERRLVRRARGAASFALPSIALALVPKCPMCIVAWLAIGGGFGVSVGTAAHLRTALVWLCWSVLVLLAARVAMRLASRSTLKRSTFKSMLRTRMVVTPRRAF